MHNTSEEMFLYSKWAFQKLSLEESLASLRDGFITLPPSINELSFVLKRCRKRKEKSLTLSVYAYICELGLERERSVGNYLVLMLAESTGCVHYSRQVFDRLKVRNELSWNSLINSYANSSTPQHAFTMYENMEFDPSGHTFVAIAKACARLRDLERGLEIHADISRRKFLETNLLVGNALIDMYVKCGGIVKAHKVFDDIFVRDVVSWNALMAGYADYGLGEKAIDLLEHMKAEGISPSDITYVCILKACGKIGAIDKMMAIHADIERRGILESNCIVGTVLVDVYAKCGLLVKAQEIFNRLPIQDVLSWTALITRNAEQGQGEEAMKYFDKMKLEGVSPDFVAYLSTLKACSRVGASDRGGEIHADIERQGLLERDSLVGTTLVDMYAKCGSLVKAQQVFNTLQVHDVVSWNALMTGYNHFGEIENVFHLFDKMLEEGTEPDSVTFIVILNACSRMGLWYKGEMYFQAMTKDYGIIPIIDHHACMIDLLSRAGQLDKAYGMIEKLPICPNVVVWHTILGACKSLGNVEYGKEAFKHVTLLDKTDGSAYLFLSHIYAGDGRSRYIDKHCYGTKYGLSHTSLKDKEEDIE